MVHIHYKGITTPRSLVVSVDELAFYYDHKTNPDFLWDWFMSLFCVHSHHTILCNPELVFMHNVSQSRSDIGSGPPCLYKHFHYCLKGKTDPRSVLLLWDTLWIRASSEWNTVAMLAWFRSVSVYLWHNNDSQRSRLLEDDRSFSIMDSSTATAPHPIRAERQVVRGNSCFPQPWERESFRITVAKHSVSTAYHSGHQNWSYRATRCPGSCI